MLIYLYKIKYGKSQIRKYEVIIEYFIEYSKIHWYLLFIFNEAVI